MLKLCILINTGLYIMFHNTISLVAALVCVGAMFLEEKANHE